MASFKDKSGQEWTLEVTTGPARRLKTRSDNPIDILNPDRLANAIDDHFDRFDLLWTFCEDQATARGLTVDQFDKLLASEEAYASSGRALKEALTDFFRQIGMHALAEVITKTVAARARLDGVALTKVKSQRADALIDLAVEKAEEAIERAFDVAERKLREIPGSTSMN